MVDVSIIIPVYNVKKYLIRCLESVICQSYPNIEIILVDDGSTDGSDKICDEYEKKDDRFHVFHKLNGGLGSARNYGMYKANGEFIIFLDSDDWLRNDTVEKVVKDMKKYSLDMYLFGAEIVMENESISKKVSVEKYERNSGINKILTGVNALYIGLKRNEYYPSVCLRMYRTAFLKKYGFSFNEKYIHEDEDFGLLCYIPAKRVMISKEKFYYRFYRVSSIMTSRRPILSIEGYCNCIRAILDYIENYRDKKIKMLCVKKASQLLGLVFMNFDLVENKEKKKVTILIRNTCRRMLKYMNDSRTVFSSISVNLFCLLKHIKILLFRIMCKKQ